MHKESEKLQLVVLRERNGFSAVDRDGRLVEVEAEREAQGVGVFLQTPDASSMPSAFSGDSMYSFTVVALVGLNMFVEKCGRP